MDRSDSDKMAGRKGRYGIPYALVLGGFICLGLSILGYTLGSSLIHFKELDRTVTVKGLAEREVNADIALWPITFSAANNSLTGLYSELENSTREIVSFLREQGFTDAEITLSSATVVDKQAQLYGDGSNANFRYTASQTITVYSTQIDLVLATENRLVELGKKGIAVGGDGYQRTEYFYNGLNAIKPEMIEEATRNAREVANKFAQDSESQLGKIKSANQGQFTISDRDSNTPYIKNVRVVSTIEYYLSD